ncbi:chromo' (CHRromatin Organization MOdifier) domain protein [Trichuris suis]|nr:chromo' (CHRromatin Organization MOdifier) domain protein [Trichuris suis]
MIVMYEAYDFLCDPVELSFVFRRAEMSTKGCATRMEIERLLCKRFRQGKPEYLAKWKGHSWRSSIWLAEEDLHRTQLIKEFEERERIMQEAVDSESISVGSTGQDCGDEDVSSQFDENYENGNLSSHGNDGADESASEYERLNSFHNYARPAPVDAEGTTPLWLPMSSDLCTDDDPISVGFEFPVPKGYFSDEVQEAYGSMSVDVVAKELNIPNPSLCYFTSHAKAKLSSFKKLILVKYSIPSPYDIEFAYGYQLLPEYFSIKDVVNLFLMGKKMYVHFYFRVLKRSDEEAKR